MKLFINACVRRESRTRRLAEAVMAGEREAYKEVCVPAIDFPRVDEAFIDWRNGCVARGDYASPVFDLARDFARAEEIVVAAPFWDLSFPAALKQYLEQICNVPCGLCRAKRLTYVTTAGGPIFSEEPGYGYVRALATAFFGIKETRMVKAENLDIRGADVEGILREAMDGIARS